MRFILTAANNLLQQQYFRGCRSGGSCKFGWLSILYRGDDFPV